MQAEPIRCSQRRSLRHRCECEVSKDRGIVEQTCKADIPVAPSSLVDEALTGPLKPKILILWNERNYDTPLIPCPHCAISCSINSHYCVVSFLYAISISTSKVSKETGNSKATARVAFASRLKILRRHYHKFQTAMNKLLLTYKWRYNR